MHIVFSSKEEKECAAKVIEAMRLNALKISTQSFLEVEDAAELDDVLGGIALLVHLTDYKRGEPTLAKKEGTHE